MENDKRTSANFLKIILSLLNIIEGIGFDFLIDDDMKIHLIRGEEDFILQELSKGNIRFYKKSNPQGADFEIIEEIL